MGRCQFRIRIIPRQPTHQTIARHAGVSVSTVDRVMNQRGSVADDKFRRVLAAARSLGVEQLRLPEPWRATRRVEVVMPRNPTPFWMMLNRSLEEQILQLPRHYMVQRVQLPQDSPRQWKQAIEHPVGQRHALLIAADSDQDILPSLELCRARGEIVVSLTSEIAGFAPDGHSGIDNLAAGRTAGMLMRAMTSGQGGRLLVLPPHDRRAEHRQRVEGFREAVGDSVPVSVEVTQEDPQAMIAIIRRYLAGGDLLGIYDSGWESAEIADVLRGLPVRPRWIAHECSPLHRQLLREGLLDFVLDQSPEAQVRCALHHMLAHSGDAQGEANVLPPAPPELRIICRENIPASRG
jgi:LacI family transcriptional regulator